MSTEAPVARVQERSAELAELTLKLLSFETTNPPGKTRDLVDWLERYFADLGLDTERIVADPAKPNLTVTVPGEHDRTLLYLGHADTVPFETDEWTYDPLGERVENRIYGRGATDMKGSVAAMVETIRSFVETETIPPVTLRFTLVSDEETAGAAGLSTLLDRSAVDAAACVIGETTCQYGNHSVTVADRGSIWLTIASEGIAAHGSRPVLGENAIDRLYDAIETIRARFGTRTFDIPSPVVPIIEESIAYYEPVMDERTARELFSRPSINLGTIEGGESINTVPTSARAQLDIRLSPGVETSSLLSDLRACMDECEGVEITDVSWSTGTYEDPDGPLVESVASVARSVTGSRIYRRSATGGGDAKKLRNAGIPTVEFALGTDTVHAVDEYTTLDSLVDTARIYTQLPYVFADTVLR